MSVEEVKLDETNSELVQCWQCGGEGHLHDCFDGCCLDADEGCDDCVYACDICCGIGAYRVPFDRLREGAPQCL